MHTSSFVHSRQNSRTATQLPWIFAHLIWCESFSFDYHLSFNLLYFIYEIWKQNCSGQCETRWSVSFLHGKITSKWFSFVSIFEFWKHYKSSLRLQVDDKKKPYNVMKFKALIFEIDVVVTNSLLYEKNSIIL